MLPLYDCWRWPVLVLAITLAAEPAAASAAATWLPDGTDVVLTFNFRQFLEDHKHTEAIQAVLKPWRLAIRGDESELRQDYRRRDLEKTEGVTEREFLDRARMLKSFSDSLGLNPLEDVDLVTCGFSRNAADSWVIIVEGRFQKERLRSSVQRLVQQAGGSFKATRMGTMEVWQVPGDANGICMVLLNSKTLAIAGRKEPIAELVARAAGAKHDAPAPERRALLEQAEKQHVALFLDHVDTLLTEAGTAWMDETALGVGDEAFAKVALEQMASWTRRYGKDMVCATIGLSVHGTESSLQFGLMTRKPETAKELATRLNVARVLAGLAAKVRDDQRSRQVADMLLRARVTASETVVVVHVPVPHAFVKAVADDSQTTLHPLTERLGRSIMSIPLWRPLMPPAPGALAVEEVRDIAYRDGAAADPIRHRLDLFLPRGKKNYPVVVLVHGGGWDMGDNRCCGLYSSVGHFLASQGIGAVLPNYRLTPAVAHPEHARDVARAVRWTRDHIAEYGGAPDRIFLMGHSAGGHLVSLLATDQSYLKAEGFNVRDLKGVIAVSGVYRIPSGTLEVFLGGSGRQSFRPDQVLPLRGETGPLPMLPALGISVRTDPFGPPFGADPKGRADASPVNHVRRGLPPFLILVADKDLPSLPEMAAEFHKALLRQGRTARLIQMNDRNHNSLMFSIIRPDDPAARAVLTFIK